jgi:glycosyltransferase involved in cell wall biosynthesis
MNVLVPNDALDKVTRMMLERVDKCSDINVFIAGPGEKYETSPITSKVSWAAIKDYRKLMKSLDIDVTYSPSTSGLSNMLIASLGLKVNNIGYRGTQAKVHRSDPTNYLALLNPRVKHIVCGTPDIQQYLATRISPKKLSGRIKPYMLEWVEDAMNNPKRIENQPADAFKLIYIGVSIGRPHKGLSQLLDAMKLLQDKPITLTVIGEAGKEDMESAPASVTFLGNRKDAVYFIPSHDLYVLSSTRDASPRVVREAQACGVPCIVTDIPGARDLIIPGKTGELVAPNDAKALADSIIGFYNDRSKLASMAANTRPFIKSRFNMDDYVNYYIDLFHSQSR